MPIAGSTSRVDCFTTDVTEVRMVLTDGNNAVATDNGVPETVFCSGSDSLTLDLRDTRNGTCNSTVAAVGVGRPIGVVGRSARVRDGVARLRLFCPRKPPGRRVRRSAADPAGGESHGRARYEVRAGRRGTLPVRLATAVRGRAQVRLLAVERDASGRPMTTPTALVLRSG